VEGERGGEGLLGEKVLLVEHGSSISSERETREVEKGRKEGKSRLMVRGELGRQGKERTRSAGNSKASRES